MSEHDQTRTTSNANVTDSETVASTFLLSFRETDGQPESTPVSDSKPGRQNTPHYQSAVLLPANSVLWRSMEVVQVDISNIRGGDR